MIKGLDHLFKRLEKYENTSIKKSVEKSIQLVQSAAIGNCQTESGWLRERILTSVSQEGDVVTAICHTSNVPYAPYVEFGTGPKGQAHHEGISPNVAVAYTQTPWWIHESQIDKETAERYKWFFIDTPDGRFYQCTGQPARPFLYPALKDNEKNVAEIISDDIREQLK